VKAPMAAGPTGRRILFIALGAAGLMLKHAYHGPLEPFVHGYGGNITASFSVYFLAAIQTSSLRLGLLWAAGLALAVVEAFELTDGFGVMANTYDPFDLLANAAGIGVALAVDSAFKTGTIQKDGR